MAWSQYAKIFLNQNATLCSTETVTLTYRHEMWLRGIFLGIHNTRVFDLLVGHVFDMTRLKDFFVSMLNMYVAFNIVLSCETNSLSIIFFFCNPLRTNFHNLKLWCHDRSLMSENQNQFSTLIIRNWSVVFYEVMCCVYLSHRVLCDTWWNDKFHILIPITHAPMCVKPQ